MLIPELHEIEFEDFKLHLKEKAPTTIEAYTKNVANFLSFIKEKPLKDLSKKDFDLFFDAWEKKHKELELEKYKQAGVQIKEESIKLSRTTRNLFKASLKDFLKENGLAELGKELKFQKPASTPSKAISKEDVIKISGQKLHKNPLLNERNRLCILALYSSGFRINELATLQKSSLQILQKPYSCIVEAKNSKNKDEGKLILSNEWVDDLKKYFKARKDNSEFVFVSGTGRPLSVNSLRVFCYSMSVMAKVFVIKNGLKIAPSTHCLGRRSFATKLLNKGINVKVIEKLLRHSSLAITEKYLSIDDENYLNTVSPLDSD